ncbi:hypothetical protein [Halomonas sp. Y3]|uniref:hypothetical protein n=1 Tax=Halomonas sp. Y3 TaxID=2956797 RepID=UPI0020A1FFC5|nr:hypothetical protein [Halomonas sp. Y3]
MQQGIFDRLQAVAHRRREGGRYHVAIVIDEEKLAGFLIIQIEVQDAYCLAIARLHDQVTAFAHDDVDFSEREVKEYLAWLTQGDGAAYFEQLPLLRRAC